MGEVCSKGVEDPNSKDYISLQASAHFMQRLDSGTAFEVIFSEIENLNNREQILETLLQFSKIGPEFYSAYYETHGGLTPEQSERVGVIQKENDAIDPEKNKMRLKEQMQNWIKEGYKYMYPQSFQKWRDNVEAAVRLGEGYAKVIQDSLALMKKIQEGVDFEQINASLDENIPVLETILYFSKAGPEFYSAYYETHGGLTPEQIAKVERIKKENLIFSGPSPIQKGETSEEDLRRLAAKKGALEDSLKAYEEILEEEKGRGNNNRVPKRSNINVLDDSKGI